MKYGNMDLKTFKRELSFYWNNLETCGFMINIYS